MVLTKKKNISRKQNLKSRKQISKSRKNGLKSKKNMRGGGLKDKFKGVFGSSPKKVNMSQRPLPPTPKEGVNKRQIIKQGEKEKVGVGVGVGVEQQKLVVEQPLKTSGEQGIKLEEYITQKKPNVSTSNNSHKNLITSFLAEKGSEGKSRFERINTLKLSEASKIANPIQRQKEIDNLFRGKFAKNIKNHLVTTLSSDKGKDFIKHIEDYKKSLEENKTPHADLTVNGNGTVKIVSNVEKRNEKQEQKNIISSIEKKQNEIKRFQYGQNNTVLTKLNRTTPLQISNSSNSIEVFNKLNRTTPLQKLIQNKLADAKQSNLNLMKITNISKLTPQEIKSKISEYEGLLDKHSSVLTRNNKQVIQTKIDNLNKYNKANKGNIVYLESQTTNPDTKLNIKVKDLYSTIKVKPKNSAQASPSPAPKLYYPFAISNNNSNNH